MSNSQNYFITGVTGTLGKELIREILETTPHRLFVLIRGKKNLTPQDRLKKILSLSGLEKCLGSRIEAVDGDITFPGFGLQPEVRERLTRETDQFFHVAALTALNGSQEECFNINLGGTKEALALAKSFREKGKLKRFFYFSTAYVAGSRQTYCSREDGLPAHPAHANFYEASKYEAEKCVRAAMSEGLPATIFRPSIVVGHSQTGATSEFNVIYPFLKLFAHRIMTRLPSRRENSFNIVPIDFVIQASLEIAGRADSVGKAYHLVTQDPPSIGLLMDVAREEYPQLPPVELIDPDDFDPAVMSGQEKFVFDMLAPYLGYLNDNLTFDTVCTEAALKGTGIKMPKTDADFLKRLLAYAVDAGYLVVS